MRGVEDGDSVSNGGLQLATMVHPTVDIINKA